MSVANVIESLQKFSKKTFSTDCKVITVKKTESGWQSEIEIVVEDEEMRRFARTPVIGLWAIELDPRYNVSAFVRKGMREKTALQYDIESES